MQNEPFSIRSRRGAASIEYAIVAVAIISGVGMLVSVGSKISNRAMHASSGVFADGKMSPTVSTPRAKRSSLSHSESSPSAMSSVEWFHCGALLMLGLVYVWKVHRKPEVVEEEAVAQLKTDPGEALRSLILAKRNGLLSTMTQDATTVMNSEVEVRHLMSTSIRTVEPEVPAEEVASMMRKTKLHHLMVCDGKRLLGVISDRDLSRRGAKFASELMTRNPIAVPPDTKLIPAVTTMINRRFSSLPVTEDGDLVGVLTRTDLLVAFQCMLHLVPKMQQGVCHVKRD